MAKFVLGMLPGGTLPALARHGRSGDPAGAVRVGGRLPVVAPNEWAMKSWRQ